MISYSYENNKRWNLNKKIKKRVLILPNFQLSHDRYLNEINFN